jgi:hypothetical protein
MLCIAGGKLRKVAIGAACVGMLSVLAVLAFSTNGAAGSAPPPVKPMTGKPGNATFKGKPKLTPRVIRPKTSANPQDSLARIDYDWPGIDFGNGVHGYSHLTIREDGSYSFTGHFHNDSLISFNEVLTFMPKDDQNRVYGFTTQGHTQGFGEGSRDYDWNNTGTNKDIAANWASIWASTAFSGKAYSGFDFGGLLDDILKALKAALGVVGEVITVVGPLIPLLS